MPGPLPRARRLSSRGVVTRGDLERGGVDPTLGGRLARRGTWLRLAPSTYLTHAGPPTDGQLAQAARRHAGGQAIVTGLVACRALGLADVPDDRVVEVLIPARTRSVSTSYVVVHQTTRPPATWTRGGVAYAMPERAVVDGARRLDDLRAVRALVLGAVCRGVVSPADLSVEVEAGARRGSGLVRRAVDDALAGAWSAPEAEAAGFVGAAVRCGRLAPYALNPVLRLRCAVVGRPDGYLPGTGVGWQVDSRRFHGGDDDFDATLAVHDTFAAAGLTLLHVTPRRLRRLGPAWVEALVAAVEARGDRPEPPGLEVELHAPLQDGRTRPPLRKSE